MKEEKKCYDIQGISNNFNVSAAVSEVVRELNIWLRMTFLGRLSFEQIEFAFQFPWFELRNTQKRKVAMGADLFEKKFSLL